MSERPLICVIDDDASLCRALVRLIESMGYRCCSFESAEAALASHEVDAAACFVTDIHMPGMDGFGFKRALDLSGSRAHVIMMTGRGEQHLERLALEAGAICLMRKPLRAEALAAYLTRAVDAR